MPRIAGVDVPEGKRVVIALAYIFGIGPKSAADIISLAGLNPDTRAKNLTEEEVNKIRSVIEKNYQVEGELRRKIGSNIKRLKEIASYRGSRHIKNLPARGQRTRTNARTKRGRRQAIGGLKKTEKG